MLDALIGLLFAGGLVAIAATNKLRMHRADERRLAALHQALQRGEITLDQAEDGAVIARRCRRSDLEVMFKKKAALLKKDRR